MCKTPTVDLWFLLLYWVVSPLQLKTHKILSGSTMQRDKEASINIYMVLLALLALSTTVQGRFLFSVSHIGCKEESCEGRKEGRKEGSNQASQLCVPNPCRVFLLSVAFLSFYPTSSKLAPPPPLQKILPRRKLTHPACPFCRRPCKVTYIHRYMFLPQVLSNWGCWKKSSTQGCWDEESLAFIACRCWELWLITPCRTCAREEAWWRIGARCKAWLAAASRMLATAWWHWKHN